jgi:hypothetical protein
MREPRCGALVAAHNIGDTIHLDLWHPREEGAPSKLELGLVDDHPVDSLLVEYDFDRDGWSIRQASQFPGPVDDTHGLEWAEVAFVKAWGRRAAP